MSVTNNVLTGAYRDKYLKIHLHGTITRSVGSMSMWLFALFAFWVNEIQVSHFIGISCSMLFLVLIGPLAFFTLKRISHQNTFANFSLFINFLEVLGYTAAIYSLGGLEATYLTLIYAALISYVGVMAPKRVPFVVAGFCAFAFGSVVVLSALDIMPIQKIDPHFNPPLMLQFIILSVVICLLFIVAYISSFTASRLKKGRDRLRLKNKELEKALKEIKALRGILPLCSFCKKIRDDKGYWEQVDVYIHKYLQADVSHSLCPECAKKQYPDLYEEIYTNDIIK